MRIVEEFFPDRVEAAGAAAEYATTSLKRRLAKNQTASLVVSGGSTPKRCLNVLSATPLDWDRVQVTPSDERWVPPSDAASNERMIRKNLITDCASAAQFVSLYRPGQTPEEACDEVDAALGTLPQPFASVILGMGEDGHFASLFPDAEKLDRGLNLETKARCLPVTTKASSVQRITLTLSTLLNSDKVVLLIFGDEKRGVFESAKANTGNFPVARLLHQDRTAVRVIWAS